MKRQPVSRTRACPADRGGARKLACFRVSPRASRPPASVARGRFSARPALAVSLALALLSLCAAAVRAKDDAALPKDLPPYGQDRPLPVASIDQTTLPNGLAVWSISRPGLPRFCAVLAVRGGTASDPADMLGLGRILGDVLKEGTPSRTSRQIAEQLQAVGGQIYTSVLDDAIEVSVQGLSTGFAPMLTILGDVAREASFPEAEVELAKANAIQNLLVQESDPSYLAEKTFAGAVFAGHPYRLVSPTNKVIEAITPQTLRTEHGRRFRPDRALLVVVGAVDKSTVQKEARRVFASWKSKGADLPATPPVPPDNPRRIFLLDRAESVQSEIRVGRPTVKATDPAYYPLLVANTVFGSSSSGRLFSNLREDKGYTYTPYSQVTTYEEGGSLEAMAAVRTEVTGATLMELRYELDRMGLTTVDDGELDRAKRYQTGLYLVRNEIRSSLAYTLASNWIKGLEAGALADFVPRVHAVTAAQIREVGQEYFASNSQTIIVVGNAQSVRRDLEQFGTVETVAP